MTDGLMALLDLDRLQARLLLTALILLLTFGLRWIILRIVFRRTDDLDLWYVTRKWVTYVTVIIAAFWVASLWIEPLGDLATFLGLVSAGIAIALADVLKNIAGWVYILSRRPFRVGDRVEFGDVAGDVIDLRVFRFDLLEIGNWVHADQSTGRIIHVPNGRIFVDPLINATEGFEYIWHEIEVLITFESDWELGEQLLRGALERAAPDVSADARERIRRAAREYKIRYTHLTPTVYVSVRDSGVLLTGRMLVDARSRRGAEQDVWRELLRALADEPHVELAYPTIRTFLHEPIEISRPQRHAAQGPATRPTPARAPEPEGPRRGAHREDLP